MQPVDFGNLAGVIDNVNALIEGKSATEVIDFLKAVENAGGPVSSTIINGGAGSAISATGATAAEAFEAFKEAGGAISGSGAASVGASEYLNAGIYEYGATSELAIGALGSLSLPVSFAAAAPLFGVAVGLGLYELDPELWSNISQRLLPFCYEGKLIDAVIMKASGQAYMRASLLEAVAAALDENLGSRSVSPEDTIWEKITPTSHAYFLFDEAHSNNSLELKKVSSNVKFAIFLYQYGQNAWSYGYLAASNFQGNLYTKKVGYSGTPELKEVNTRYYKDGKSVYYGYSVNTISSADVPSWILGSTQKSTVKSGISSISTTDLEELAWLMIWGNAKRDYSGHEGVSDWGDGSGVDYTQKDPVNVVMDAAGNTEPYYPVYLPVGDFPYTSPSPLEVPDPQAPSLPDAYPMIQPQVAPEIQFPDSLPTPEKRERESPVPDPGSTAEPEINPSTDPSAEPEVEPEPAPEPEPEPQSQGDTDLPVFPPTPFPTIVASGSGLIHVYNLTPAQMIAFGQWLWVTYADATIDKIWSNPMDGIIGAFEIYATPSTSGNDYIRSGFLVSDVQGALVNPRYKRINCGSIVIPEYYGNYLDYSPYSKAHICLPFIGVVELNSDDIVGHAVNVTYIIDMYNGSCIAQITVAKDNYECMMYQYSGNCAVDVPIAGGSQAAIKAGMIGAAANGITSVLAGFAAGGPIGGIAGAAVGMGGGVIGAALSNKASVQHSGTFGSSFGAMGPKKPYIIIHRPIQKRITNYNLEYGFPAHKRVVIGSCSGFLRAFDVHVISPTATDEEKAQIEEMLKSGVFV